MPSNVTSAEPVRKSVTVPAAPQRAFELFTAHMHEWWPLATHSVGAVDAVSVTFGGGAGAAILETVADGTTSVWGTITHWEPPYRVAFTWHPGTNKPGCDGPPPRHRGDLPQGGTGQSLP
jgi:uncharacterized protein YndB with AHSA1/START domain